MCSLGSEMEMGPNRALIKGAHVRSHNRQIYLCRGGTIRAVVVVMMMMMMMMMMMIDDGKKMNRRDSGMAFALIRRFT